MNINELASTPTLIKITLDDESLVETYGEPITFWAYDIVSLTTYFEFFESRSSGKYEVLNQIIKKLILLEDGTPAIKEGQDLPIDIAAQAITKLGDILGKQQGKTSTQTVGAQQE